ncbi:MAG: DinB superfamily protein [bacterium ADurb.Bin429]|nr:MAG: DinB superfamily protein [bacterium ADurb.Bin429]
MNNHIVTTLRNQFARVWAMWRSEIGNIPEAEWRSGDLDYLTPVRHACHAFETADFYTGIIPADQFPWGRHYAGNWEGSPVAELPDHAGILSLLEKIAELVDTRLTALSDDDLNASDPVFPWTGGTRLDTFLYLLRHTQHHLGELHAELRRRNIPRAAWK